MIFSLPVPLEKVKSFGRGTKAPTKKKNMENIFVLGIKTTFSQRSRWGGGSEVSFLGPVLEAGGKYYRKEDVPGTRWGHTIRMSADVHP